MLTAYLHILIREDLVGRVLRLVRVERRALNPVAVIETSSNTDASTINDHTSTRWRRSASAASSRRRRASRARG
jgi:hypothetical protein